MRRTFIALLLACAWSCRPSPAERGPYFFAHRLADSETDFDEVRFRSFRKDGQLAGQVVFPSRDDISESRFSLIPPLPSRLTYRVDVPVDGQLDFEIGVGALGAKVLPAPVTFVVEIDAEPRFEETIRRRFGDTWLRRSLDLSDWSETTVDVTFETHFQSTPFANASELASSALAAWGNPVLGGSSDENRQPDLILVSIDCLRADHVGVYGHEKPTTPALDGFAEDAVVFENAVSVSSWTLPTHMTMLTGLMPTEHGLRRTQKRFPNIPYLPEILSREGYETMGVVSGLYLSPTFGYDDGFDIYSSLIDEPAEKLVDAALAHFLVQPRRPRFLFLHFFDAHWPYLPDEKYLKRAGGRPRDISNLLQNVIQRRAPRHAGEIAETKTLYDAEVAYVDEHLGRFFDALKETGVYDSALIVVTADHGEGFFEHEAWQHSEIIYNEVTRVPLIVKPSKHQSAKRVVELVSQLGIFPTFLHAIGRETPFDHPSLVALSEGDAHFPKRTMSEITWEAKETTGPLMKLAVTEGYLKYVATLAGEIGGEMFVSELVREELYDLSTDPGEKDNLLPARASDVGDMRSDVRDFLAVVQKRRSANPGEPVTIDKELEEKLRALGYVQ